jgi:sugar phosphate permease
MKSQMIGAMGSISIGLVWGWLSGCLSGRVRRPLIALPPVFLAVVLVTCQVVWFFALPEAFCLWAAFLFALAMAVAVRRALPGYVAVQNQNKEMPR